MLDGADGDSLAPPNARGRLLENHRPLTGDGGLARGGVGGEADGGGSRVEHREDESVSHSEVFHTSRETQKAR